MSTEHRQRSISLLRPSERWPDYDKEVWQRPVAFALAVMGLMIIVFVTVFSGPVADWVSDLTDPAKASVVESRTGRVEAFNAWLFPLFFLGLAIVLTGISIALWGVIRRIWVRVQSIDEALPHLKRQGG